jgi:6-phosphofructokinase
MLGSSRSKRFYDRASRAAAVRQLEEYSITGVIVIGGNGSMAGLHALSAEADVPAVGIPASIDNDIGLTREALGVDSALNTIVEACDTSQTLLAPITAPSSWRSWAAGPGIWRWPPPWPPQPMRC